MVSYQGSQRNIRFLCQINHSHAEPAMINKRNPNEAQKQSDPGATVIKTQNWRTDSWVRALPGVLRRRGVGRLVRAAVWQVISQERQEER